MQSKNKNHILGMLESHSALETSRVQKIFKWENFIKWLYMAYYIAWAVVVHVYIIASWFRPRARSLAVRNLHSETKGSRLESCC